MRVRRETPGFFLEPYRPWFIAVDNLSLSVSSAPRVQGILRELDLLDHVQILDADVRDLAARLPDGFAPIDLTWIDTIVCLYFFENRWELVNPDGRIVLMHYLMTYPEGEAVLEYTAEFQRTRPGELEIVDLLEPHKLIQNSVTILRRTAARGRDGGGPTTARGRTTHGYRPPRRLTSRGLVAKPIADHGGRDIWRSRFTSPGAARRNW